MDLSDYVREELSLDQKSADLKKLQNIEQKYSKVRKMLYEILLKFKNFKKELEEDNWKINRAYDDIGNIIEEEQKLLMRAHQVMEKTNQNCSKAKIIDPINI